MSRASLACVLMLAACTSGDSATPRQSTAAVNALFADALRACTAPLAEDGSFDQRAVAEAGWQEQRRTTRLDTTERVHAAGTRPVLRPGEYEATTWTHPTHSGELTIVRYDATTRLLTADLCSTTARLASGEAVASVVAALGAALRTPVSREGDMPRGGDFLTARTDDPPHGYYWQLPRHDVYLVSQGAGHLRVDVVAMPDRAALDAYSPDRPERRIP